MVKREVGVVRTEGDLLAERNAKRPQAIRKPFLVVADAEISRLSRLCALLTSSHWISATSTRRLGDNDAASQLWPLLEAQPSGILSRSHGPTSQFPRSVQTGVVDASFRRETHSSLTSQVPLVHRPIVQVQTTASASHAVSIPNWRRD